MESKTFPKGFVSVDEAVELIKSDTRDDAKVDIEQMVASLKFLEEQHNFRIPLVRLATKEDLEEFRKRYPGKRHRGLVDLGSVNAVVRTSLEKYKLKAAIVEHFQELSGREFEEALVKSITTVNDQETGGGVMPRKSKKSVAKVGDTIGSGEIVTTNSASGAGA